MKHKRFLSWISLGLLLLIDSVMRLEAKLSDRERMEMALLQGDALYGGSLCPDDERSIPATVVPLPELDEAAAYYYPERNNSTAYIQLKTMYPELLWNN